VTGPGDRLREACSASAAPRGPCLSAERLIAFYGGEIEGPEAEALREHLAACPVCLELARDARTFLAAMGDETLIAAQKAAPTQRAWGRRWAAAAALFLVAGLAAWGWWRHARAPAWQELTIAKAEYPLPRVDDQGIVWRGEEEETDAFAQAIDPYVRGDYAAAEQRLATYLRQHPKDPEADLYRGVSLLLLRRRGEAIAPLEETAGSGQEPVASEARWYLAQAYLATGAISSARHELERLAAGASHRSAEAKDLLRRMED